MSTMPAEQRDPLQTWNDIVDFADGAELDAINAMSPEDFEAELVSIGYYESPAAAAPRAAESGARLADVDSSPFVAQAADPVEGNVVAFEPRRRRRFLGVVSPLGYVGYAAAAATAAVIAAQALHLFNNKPPPAPPPPKAPESPVPSSPPAPMDKRLLAAIDIRALAEKACDAQRWSECLSRLDRAKELDSDGDGEQAVQDLRAVAGKGITELRARADAHEGDKRPAPKGSR
jgi:hypothetical protein